MIKKLLLFGCLFSGLATFAQQKNTTPRPMKWTDVSTWRYVPTFSVNMAPNGKWTAYALVSAEGDGEIILKNLTNDAETRYPIGGNTMPSMEFSENGKWFVYKEYPKFKEAKAASKSPGRQLFEKLHVIDLATLKSTTFDKAGRYSFNGKNGDVLAIPLLKERAPGGRADEPSTFDLLIFEPGTGQRMNLGNVGEFSFNKEGNLLAYTVQTANKAENGLFIIRPTDKKITVLDNDTVLYKSLNWNAEKDALAVLKMSKDKNFKNDKGSVFGVKNVSTQPLKYTYDPQKDSLHFPKGMTVSPNKNPVWSEDLSRIFFGINTWEAVKKEMEKPAADTSKANTLVDLQRIKSDTSIKTVDDLKKALARLEAPKEKPTTKNDADKPDMVIWNWKDSRLQSLQQVAERSDKNYAYTAMFDTRNGKFIQLNDSTALGMRILPKENFAIGTSDLAYQLDRSLDGQNYVDLFIVNLQNGERKTFKEKFYVPSGSSMPNPSPDGKRFVFGNNGHFYLYDLTTGTETNLTASIPTSFVNTEDDHNVTKPLTWVVGWSTDGKQVLIRDLWDIWQINIDAPAKAINLTQNGKQEKIVYQQYYNLNPDDKGIDLKKPQYFSIFGDRTKKSGIVRLEPGNNGLKPGAKVLIWEDASVGNLGKSTTGEVYYYSKGTFNKSPEFYTSNQNLNSPKQVTSNTPDASKYTFSSGTRLVDYVTDKGDSLQGVLYLPAGYKEGMKYPTIVYYYEKTSQNRHNYVNPAFPRTGHNFSIFTSNGYAVFTPDIVYKLDDPGMSAVWAVLPAVKAAIATGIVDSAKMAITGHSWGGYQTAFLATQTNMFKAAAPGAALTDMVSMYSLIYWNSGGGNMSIFEASQGRFRGAPWENWDSYLRNSPLYYVKQVNTPILMLHNDKDGAVDFTQGVEFYNALRRLKKPIVMVQYKGENHGLAKVENMKDYGVRMLEFFDHFLKGAPAPDWWTNGVDRLKLADHLEDRAF